MRVYDTYTSMHCSSDHFPRGILHYIILCQSYIHCMLHFTIIDTLRTQGDWSPFSNGQMSVTSSPSPTTSTSSSTEYDALKLRFRSWHDPIPDTINRCPSQDVMLSYAYASPAPRPGIYSTLYVILCIIYIYIYMILLAVHICIMCIYYCIHICKFPMLLVYCAPLCY